MLPPGARDEAVALGRKNRLFARSTGGGERAAAIDTLIQIAKPYRFLSGTYLQHVIGGIVEHVFHRVAGPIPWNRDASANIATATAK